jgi:molybdopterin converting factor small subunit
MSSSLPYGHFALLYFASASSFTGKDMETFEGPMSLPTLFVSLEKKYAGIKNKILDSCLITVNLEYVDVNENDSGVVINAGDEVAIIPPVSSG